jgi:predicted DNA-binding transcriptional regulator YafY
VLQTSARLLRLLSLLQGRRHWSGAELAERLAVTERTVRRDVDRLRSLGYPVQATSGVAGGYKLGAGASLPPLSLDEDEALAVVVGLRTAAGGTVAGLEEMALRALVKLEQVLPARLRRRAKALHTSIVPLYLAGPRVDASLLATLAAACRDSERLAFAYEDRGGAASERSVEPHGLAHTGGRWYLAAWDVVREAWRTFRVDRIKRGASTGVRFAPRELPEGSVAAFVSRSVASSGYPIRARLILHAPYEEMITRVSPASGVLERLEGDRCLMEAGASSLDMLAVWTLMLGVEFDVLEPPGLPEYLRRLAARAERAASRAPAAERVASGALAADETGTGANPPLGRRKKPGQGDRRAAAKRVGAKGG